eukprot:GHUV01055105.1.p1 GENE.GHUV01055105.1~~GHUV01055105.1.p1  ORF type:complete len:203 (+),score=34.81 GHUV01055105.1:593-1201(+)
MTLAFIRDLRLTCCAALADHSARMVVTGSVLRPQWQQFCCQILQSPHKASCCPTSRYPGLHTSSSYRQLTTVGCCHQYTISGYALARSLGPGTRMCSDLFEAGGQQFRLEVYPAGVSADAARHVSVFLTTQASVNPNHIIYEIAVLDQSGRNRHLVHASKPQQGPCMMPLSGVVAGYPCFVRHALLDKHARRYLLNDCLVVR